MDKIYNDNRTVAELTHPISSELKAWQRFEQMEREYEERHRGEENGRSLQDNK